MPRRCTDAFCQCPANQSHTAQYHDADGRIFYRYHPRHGQVVEILKRQHFAGSEVLVVRQSDGTLTHVPCWMMQEAASHHVIGPDPLLPLAQLRDLRIEVDALLVFLRSDSKIEKGQEDAQCDPSAKRSVRGGGTACVSIAGTEEPDAAAAPGNADRGFHGDSDWGGGL
jgi:hypothetical protein